MTFFKDNFWGEKQAGFDVLYHNMKHGQLATKELAEYVRERAAIEEAYSKSMSRLAKIASNGSPLGTFAPMWDVFRVAAEKLALCHLELARKMSDLIREISKCSEEQAKVHRKVKEESTGTVEAIQSLQVQAAQLQKSQENYQSKCAELERLRREGAPQKDLEKAELKSKKAAESLLSCIEKHNRVGGDFELKMSKSAQRFQDIEEAHLRQMKLLTRAYSHSIEDTNVQVGQVHNEFMQNTENISAETLLERFAEQRGTGKERPTLVAFEEYSPSTIPEGAKRSRGKTFRIPGLGRKSKEPDSMDSAATETPDSAGVDEEGYMVPSGISQDGFSQGERSRCCSSDSDFDDEEPKKFQVQIRPLSGSGSSDPVASELELRATVGTLTLPPSRRVLMKRNVLRVSSYTAGRCSDRQRCEVPYRGWAQDGAWGSASSSSRSRVSSTLSGSDTIFGPPLETAFADATFSSDSSSPENVQDSGLDSPSHQPPGPSPEPRSWAAFGGHAKDPQCPCSEWPLPVQWKSNRIPLMDPWDGMGGDLSGSCGSPLQLDCPDDPFSITLLGSPTHQSKQWEGGDSLSQASVCCSRRELLSGNTTHNPFSERVSQCDSLRTEPQHGVGANTQSKCKTDSSVPQLLSVPDRQSTERRGGAAFGIKDNRTDWSSCEQDKTMCPSPPTGSSPIPSECKSHLQVTSPAQGLSRGSSPMSVTPQEIWPVAAAFTEYISACFPGGEDSRCLLKISGDLTMSFPAQFTRILSTNHNIPVLSFLLVLPSGVEQLLPNNNLLYSKPSQSKTEGKVFLFNMEKLRKHLQREAELNPRTSYHNVSLLKYQVSSQDPSRAPLLLSAECQRSGTVTRVSLQYWRCLTAAPGAQLSGLRALLPLEHGASDLQCQPPAAWNVEENRVLWQLPDFCVNREHGSLCASWQSLDAQRHPPPSLALQFIGFGASVSGVDVELLGSHYHMSLLKRRFTTGRYITCCSL